MAEPEFRHGQPAPSCWASSLCDVGRSTCGALMVGLVSCEVLGLQILKPLPTERSLAT